MDAILTTNCLSLRIDELSKVVTNSLSLRLNEPPTGMRKGKTLPAALSLPLIAREFSRKKEKEAEGRRRRRREEEVEEETPRGVFLRNFILSICLFGRDTQCE